MAAPADISFERRMLIDGKLVEAASGKTFANVNPATEEVIGEVTDATVADMHCAIDAARRAFDESDWSTNHAFRKRCLGQLQEALEAEQEELREELILEVGCPRMVTHGPQLDAPLAGGLTHPAKLIDEYPWEVDLGEEVSALTDQLTAKRIWREPVGVVGAIVPWNYPFEVSIHKLGQALATGNTIVLKPAPDTPFNATRIGRLVAERTDIPAGVLNVVPSSDHLIGEELTMSPKVDLISFTGSTAVGKRIMEKGVGDDEAPIPRARRQVRHHRARRRRPGPFVHDRHCALLPRRPGLCHPHPHAPSSHPLRRGRGDAQGHLRVRGAGRSPRTRRAVRSAHLGQAA